MVGSVGINRCGRDSSDISSDMPRPQAPHGRWVYIYLRLLDFSRICEGGFRPVLAAQAKLARPPPKESTLRRLVELCRSANS